MLNIKLLITQYTRQPHKLLGHYPARPDKKHLRNVCFSNLSYRESNQLRPDFAPTMLTSGPLKSNNNIIM